ncbi:MAG: polyprenol monophosphomannose synthase [Ignavibacterium sp.]
MPKSLIVIPTYNELINIEKLINDIFIFYERDIDILVVDDNSPDGTGDFVEQLSKQNKRVNVLRRPQKMGLGTAYCDGFKYALKNNYDYIFEMDADYSHDPGEIINFLTAMERYDLVIGSRYLTGVSVINWPISRVLLSYLANKYTRIITNLPVNDCTSGYKCFKRKVLEAIDLDKIKSNGYAFQIEMTFKSWKKGFKVGEIPIIFIDRQKGKSKMTKKIVWEAAFLVWSLRVRSILGIL